MKIIAEMVSANDTGHLPLVRLYIHNAPHRRMHRRILQGYRQDIRQAFVEAGIEIPIRRNIDLSVLFVDPSSPDLDNLYLALNAVMDKVVIEDDEMIQSAHIAKYFPYARRAYLSSVP